MEAQEAPYNASPSSPHTGELVRNSAEVEETTSRQTVAQEVQKVLVETETDASVKIADGIRLVEVKEHETEQWLLDIGAHESHKVEEATRILHAAETDAKLLLNEAEEHEPVRIAVEDAKTFGEFWLKFLNDWTLNFASGLAYNLLMALFPVVIALGATVGFVSGKLSQENQQALITRLSAIFPSVLGQDILKPAINILNKDAGFLGLLAIVLALYNGSRLFVAMENYFAVIYHTPTRSFLRQNLMALVMLLIFILLTPIMLFASPIGLGGLISGLIASLLLFQAIYMIVPNQHISLRNSWRGTLAAALALQLYVAIFPLYIRNFLGSYTGNTGFAIILLLFFYYFAVILLIGAEVNAFYAENVRARPRNIAEMVHQATLDADKAELEALARLKVARRSLKH